jgi:hypothetical protein
VNVAPPAGLTAHAIDVGLWGESWLVGLPLIALTVVVHVIGLGLIRAAFANALANRARARRFPLYHFALVMGITVTLVTSLHALEAAIWATALFLIGAVPTPHLAMLYSTSAMTAYGHAQVFLEGRWQMLGALEALTGLMLFGLTTAFLYGMIRQDWPARGGSG